ncbi:hypothetical protein J3458_004644 [Metarhizium acridum]|uniref:uncharacterized protein n=1 Tax=Metarhizium acridum TaxID=92637 RepID=UPI001C6B13CB|nr:hypothetical protein J3458_004644 [Metarhizium acridum]
MLRNRVIVTDNAPSTAPIRLPTKQLSSAAKDNIPPSKSVLLTISQIPEWYSENPYIHTGYRPVFAAIAPCIGSWCYLHNQSFNIYTHLIPGIFALVVNAGLCQYFSVWYPEATALDRLVFHVYLTAVSVCFGVSAAYHTLLCHSREFADLWVRLDYVSISVLILGSFVPGLYMGFYCEMGLLGAYLGMIFSMGLLNVYLSINDRYGAKNWLTSRLLPFLGMGFSAFIPIVHAAVIFPYDQLQKQSGLHYYLLEGVFMLVGVLFLAVSRYPEMCACHGFEEVCVCALTLVDQVSGVLASRHV